MTSVINQNNNRPSILVVDDSRVVRISLKNILQERYEIIEAEDGEKAWELLQENPGIRLIFSDLTMPILDGRGLLRQLRSSDDNNLRTLPLIIVTGREEDPAIRTQLIEEGANDLVTKPFNPDDITGRAERYVTKQSESTQNDSPTDADVLRGILSKVDFTQLARKQLSFAIRNKNEMAFLLMKFDKFDKITQHYSDPAIEHILLSTAEIIRSYTRIEDILSYFGEGTFAILCPAANSVGTKYLGRKILTDLQAKKFYLGESDTTVTASIGVSAPDIKPGTTLNNLLILAEQRMEAAINAGGNRVVDKGNATLTPVSTLLSEDSAFSSEKEELLKQTEISMRKLAAQEAQIRNGEHAHADNVSSFAIEKINDELIHVEHENSLLKEELESLKKQTEGIEQLQKQLYETDALQQQTQLKYQQLQEDHEKLRLRTEAVESNQSQLRETDDDHSIVEEHLLRESENLQNELNKAKEQIEESVRAQRESDAEIADLKQKLISQKEAFEVELADEHMMRAMAENKLAELEEQFSTDKEKRNPFKLTSTPEITLIEKNQAPDYKPETIDSQLQQMVNHSSEQRPTQPKSKPSGVKKPSIAKPNLKFKISWPFKILMLTMFVLMGILGYRIWDGLSPQSISSQVNKLEMSGAIKPIVKDAMRSKTKEKKLIPPQKGDRTSALPAANNSDTLVTMRKTDNQQLEEAKLQAELNLRQMAEEEFLILSDDK